MTRITTAGLNRALLARQLLLERHEGSVNQAIERLLGLQAQQARPPFVGLWSRVAGAELRQRLGLALSERRVVKATTMRGTLHLHSAEDYTVLRPALQPALTRGVQSVLRKRMEGLDLAALRDLGVRFFSERPATFKELRDHLEATRPGGDVRAMAYIIRTQVPLVQVPETSRWMFKPRCPFALAARFLDRPIPELAEPHGLVRRYLAAFGPATPADAAAWSGLANLAPVFEAISAELVELTDERGRTLYDLPDAPRPSADTPAPVRFIAAFDNLVLGHADRARIVPDAYRSRICTRNLQVRPTFTVDGMVAGLWETTTKGKRSATLTIRPFQPLPAAARRALRREAEPLLRFMEEDATERTIVIAPPE